LMQIPKIILLIGGLVLFTFLFVFGMLPAKAAPPRQLTPFPTPTPGPDGRIIYIVQPGDTLWRIAAISELSIDEIRLLNNLGPDEPILPNQALLLGLGGPVEVVPTPGPSPLPTSILPTPSPEAGTGVVCVFLFEDLNGDAFHQETEPMIPGGAISISNREGTVSQTANTSGGEEPDCFEGIPEGDYNVTVAVPEGFNPTTLLNYPLSLFAGDQTLLDFGAQISIQAEGEAPPPEQDGRSPLLGIVGAVLIIGGVGLGFFAGRLRRTP
jgi:hypothetical protein